MISLRVTLSVIERRPRLLKDFLNDTANSCSSSGFASFPRREPPALNKKIESKPMKHSVSAFRALINVVKSIHFTTVKSSQFLPRSLSRRLSKSTKGVKDAMRLASSQDGAGETGSPPSTGSSKDSSSNCTDSSSFSWCESDFTAEFLPSWCGNNSQEKELQSVRNGLPCNADAITPQDVEFLRFGETEERFSTNLDESAENLKKTRQKLIQKINEFESISNIKRNDEDEEKEEDEESASYFSKEIEEEEREYDVEESAREMLVYVKATSLTKIARVEEELLLDFFVEELKWLENQSYNWDVVSLAKSWVGREFNPLEYGSEHDVREASIAEMSKIGNWSDFKVEKEELGFQIGDDIVAQFIDEIMVDFLVN